MQDLDFGGRRDEGKNREIPSTPPSICKDVKGKELREEAFIGG
jgi:hypothetical protein